MRGHRIFDSQEQMAEAAASLFLKAGQEAKLKPGPFRVALSGGRGPVGLFQRLAERSAELDWTQVEFYWVDERVVPYADADSNFGAARHQLLYKLPATPAGVHPFDTHAAPANAAKDYEELLMAVFGAQGPFFDLCLLGMGADGHTASLFPGSAALEESRSLCLGVQHPLTGQQRLTLTYPVLNHCQQLLFLLSGADKADVFSRILKGEASAQGLPAARLKPANGELLWFADKDAAAKI